MKTPCREWEKELLKIRNMEMKMKNLQKVIFLESRVRKGRDENRGKKLKGS